MSKLYFRAGETEGFTSKKLADKKSGYANPIRELLQNSLDASKEAGNDKCEINIYIDSIIKATIPHIQDYEETLDKAIEFQKSKKSYNDNSEQIVSVIKQELKKEELKILMFVDNGKGMSPDILNGLIGERSVKGSEGSGGSFGVGHLSPYFLSSLRYVLYASKYEKTKTLFSGVLILAGFEDSEAQRGATGRILEDIPANEMKPQFNYPTQYPNFIKDKMDKINNTGSMVSILGLNKDWDNKANYAIVSNFFYAINKDELTININHKNIPVSIEKTDIDRLLENKKDEKIAQGDKILSGQAVYQCWLAVKDNDNKKEIELNNSEKVCVHIKNNIDSSSVIALVRNGMLIARHDNMLSSHINNLRKNEDFEPFSIVINVDEQDCPTLFKWVKGAENPYHNKLKKNKLIPRNEKELKKLLEELSEKIQDQFLIKKERSGSLVSMPELEIPNKAEAQGSNTNRPKSQKPKAQASKQKQKQPINKIRGANNGKKRQAPVIISRSLESTNAVRFKDNGDTFSVNLSIVPQKMEAKDEVYFSMSLAQDSDKNEADTGLDFVSLSIDNKDVPIPDFIEVKKGDKIEKEEADKSQIKLGKLDKGQAYLIKAILKKPIKVKGMSVALKPFLGLKQKKGGKND